MEWRNERKQEGERAGAKREIFEDKKAGGKISGKKIRKKKLLRQILRPKILLDMKNSGSKFLQSRRTEKSPIKKKIEDKNHSSKKFTEEINLRKKISK